MNSFGQIFKVTIFGESHGVNLGVIVDGVPAGIPLSEIDMMGDLDRRRSGAKGTTPRKESDTPTIVSGVFNGFTTGASLTVMFSNENTRSGDYSKLVSHPRPGHSDFVSKIKYEGYGDYRGGGRFSGRVTLGLVVAGVIAKKILDIKGVSIDAYITEIGGITDKSKHEEYIDELLKSGDSCGGVIECIAKGVEVGLGEPFFDSAESVISHLLFSIPAVKGVEFGSGFHSARSLGSQNNDNIIDGNGRTETNNTGGISGGITNGNDIVFRLAIKPTSSISTKQDTFNFDNGKVETLVVGGRHDACIALRVPVIVEAVTAMALADLLMLKKSKNLI